MITSIIAITNTVIIIAITTNITIINDSCVDLGRVSCGLAASRLVAKLWTRLRI